MAEAPTAATDRLTLDFDLLREEAGIITQPALAVIELRGEDRKGWLQGQATNDVRQLDLGASTSFCFCEPTGQILAICDAWSLKDRFILTCDLSARDAVLRRVEMMVVMEDVVARDLTDRVRLISVQGPKSKAVLNNMVALPTLDAADTQFEGVAVQTLRSDRTGLGGWDILLPLDAKKPAASLARALPEIGLEAFLVARLEAGRPLCGVDYTAKTLPAELGPAFEARTVSYSKGCYTGQEVLMRMHSRGHANRTWMAMIADSPVSAGDAIAFGDREDVGIVTSAAISPDFGSIAGAMIRRDTAIERDTVRVATASGPVSAQLRRMPLLRFE